MPENQLNVGLGWWGFRDIPVDRHLDIADRFGFKTLEFGLGDTIATFPLDVLEAEIESFTGTARERGIKLTHATVENDFTILSKDKEEKLARTLQEMTLARQMGADFIRLFAGFTPVTEVTEETYEWMRHAFYRSQEHADTLGLRIAIETHGQITMEEDAAVHVHTVSTHRDWLLRLVDDLPEAIGFNYDPGNLKAVEPEDDRYALDILDKRINYCHLKDWRPTGPGWVACAPGDADLDYGSLLRKMSYDGIYLIEYEPIEDVEPGIQRSLDYLKGLGFELVMG